MHVVYTMCSDFFRMQESKNKFACDSNLESFFLVRAVHIFMVTLTRKIRKVLFLNEL